MLLCAIKAQSLSIVDVRSLGDLPTALSAVAAQNPLVQSCFVMHYTLSRFLSNWRVVLFGLGAWLDKSIPAHAALQHRVDASISQLPYCSWCCRSGCPHIVWMDQLQDTPSNTLGFVWVSGACHSHCNIRMSDRSTSLLLLWKDIFENVDNKTWLILLKIHIFIISCSTCYSYLFVTFVS